MKYFKYILVNILSMPPREDLTGKKFGRLTCLECVGTQNGKALWRCKCDCGNEVIVGAYNIKSGNTQSCGCYQRSQTSKACTTHNLSKHPLYKLWAGMKERCECPKNKRYDRYGGRGIKVCEEWHDFKVFHDWAIANGWVKGLSIERIDNDGDYCPTNCKWTSIAEQQSNTSKNHRLTYNGKTQTIAEWARELNMNPTTIQCRISRYHWSVEKALTTPTRRTKRD